MTLFRDLLAMNWRLIFATKVILKVQETLDVWLSVRNIRDEVVIANLAKISRKRIKLGLQYLLFHKYIITILSYTSLCGRVSLDNLSQIRFGSSCFVYCLLACN